MRFRCDTLCQSRIAFARSCRAASRRWELCSRRMRVFLDYPRGSRKTRDKIRSAADSSIRATTFPRTKYSTPARRSRSDISSVPSIRTRRGASLRSSAALVGRSQSARTGMRSLVESRIADRKGPSAVAHVKQLAGSTVITTTSGALPTTSAKDRPSVSFHSSSFSLEFRQPTAFIAKTASDSHLICSPSNGLTDSTGRPRFATTGTA